LTLRYNPSENQIFPFVSWKNFLSTESDPNGIKTERLLRKAIRKFSSNQSFVISLSAGIDSSLSLALLRDEFPNAEIIALTAVMEGSYDESKQAKKLATQFNASFKTIPIKSIFKEMPELVFITKKPRWNTYHHLVAKEARKHGPNFVSGNGADELLGGYSFRYKKFQNLLQKNDNWKNKVTNYLECHNRDWVPDQEYLFQKKMKFDWNKIYQYFKPYFANKLNPIQQVMLADFNGKLAYDFIPTDKAICEHYGLKSISFFLEPELTNFALHLPLNQKYDPKNFIGKKVLRKITKRLGVKHLEVKRGFSPDMWNSWNTYGKKICANYLLEKDSIIFQKKIINYNWVIRAFERVEEDGDIRYLFRLISILALEIWCRIFISKEMTGSKKLK